eukprot:2596439-Prorocentrum_lima.AAC.1
MSPTIINGHKTIEHYLVQPVLCYNLRVWVSTIARVLNGMVVLDQCKAILGLPHSEIPEGLNYTR